MKKVLSVLLVLVSFVFAKEGMMKMHQSVPMDKATILQSGDAKMYCPKCGMNLPMFYKTNHSAVKDGVVLQYCSIHCLAEDSLNGKLTDMKVVDNTTLKFIDVKKAFYVVGSDKKGTMSMVSKYAFGSKEKADSFQKDSGGKVMSFDKALNLVTTNLKKESMMIAKKQAKMAKMGEKIYNKLCQKTELKFDSAASAKAHVVKNKLCGGVKGKKLQAVGLYLKSR